MKSYEECIQTAKQALEDWIISNTEKLKNINWETTESYRAEYNGRRYSEHVRFKSPDQQIVGRILIVIDTENVVKVIGPYDTKETL